MTAKIAIVPCKWHPLTAMENAARDGFCYDADAVVMPVQCTGLVKVSYLLKFFAKGMQGVLVLGCKEGDCHYYNGSERCREIVDETRRILEIANISGKRLGFHLISESQGKEFKRVLKDFLKQFKKGTRGGRTKGAKRVAKTATRRSKRVTPAGHR